MKTLQHYRYNSSISNDESKESSITNATLASLIPATMSTIHLSHCSTYQSMKNCPLCSHYLTNTNRIQTVSELEHAPSLDFSLLNENMCTKDTAIEKYKCLFKTNLIKSDLKPNIYSSLSFTNAVFKTNTLNRNETVLKSKSVNICLNDSDNRLARPETDKTVVKNTISTPWNILCKLINCKVAFKKQYNGKKYNWIQLAGHAGRFLPGEREGFILKIMEDSERKCLETLQLDVLASFVPSIDKLIYNREDDKHYTEMQDLLYKFQNPSIMDIKIGVRTFVEDDTDEKECKPRNDLYLKLIEMAPNEPNEKEHELKAITKRRYMSWRESSTCSAQFGFRIEAIKKNHVSEKEFFSVKERFEAKNHFKHFVDNNKNIMEIYVNRLISFKETLLKSEFFYNHELIGSSLLFVHDNLNAGVWMIDFGKTRPLPEGIRLTHARKWEEGNHEDGYLIGIDSLIDIFQESINELN